MTWNLLAFSTRIVSLELIKITFRSLFIIFYFFFSSHHWALEFRIYISIERCDDFLFKLGRDIEDVEIDNNNFGTFLCASLIFTEVKLSFIFYLKKIVFSLFLTFVFFRWINTVLYNRTTAQRAPVYKSLNSSIFYDPSKEFRKDLAMYALGIIRRAVSFRI